MDNLPKHHGAGPPEAPGPMQLHRLLRLKAGPACFAGVCEIFTAVVSELQHGPHVVL